MKQTNKLLKKGEFFYPHAFGMKTGYTSKAKYNLVATASNGSRELIVTLHNSETRKQTFRDAITLFDTVFGEPEESRILFNKNENTFSNDVYEAYLKDDLFFILFSFRRAYNYNQYQLA